jgi:voltage-gated potassium channel
MFALAALASVMVAGTVGYLVLGFGLLDALYQTVTTVPTVEFRKVQPLTAAGKVFTIALIVVGVGTALYTLGHHRDASRGSASRSFRETPFGAQDHWYE